MERNFVYAGAIPLDTDILSTEINAYIGLAKLSAAILGTSTVLNGFACTPTSPASLSVNIAAGEMYSLQEVDPTPYGDLGSDTSNSIVKQGVNLGITNLPISAPGTVGYSQNYLIQFQFTQEDIDPVVLAYYNPTNPSSPYSGPNNTGASNVTVRSNLVNIQALGGIAAPTGTQTTPSPSSGYVGGFVVTVANGQATITSGNISNYTGSGAATFITETLLQKISQATADARYAQQTQIQNSQFVYGVDSSITANTLTVSLTPSIASYSAGTTSFVKVANTNTGASTVNFNGVGSANIILKNGSTLSGYEMKAGMIAELFYDGSNFQLLNPDNIGINQSMQVFTSSGTFTAPVGISRVFVKAWGGGGSGGGGTSASITGTGGGAGAYVEGYVNVVPGNSYTVTIGAGGLAIGANTLLNGNAGTNTSFGSSIIAVGGGGGLSSNGLGFQAAGQGGQASACTGTLALSGGDGWATNNSVQFAGGFGGSSPNNTPSRQGSAGTSPVPGYSGQANTGQGGEGGASTGASGAGGTGLLIVYY